MLAKANNAMIALSGDLRCGVIPGQYTTSDFNADARMTSAEIRLRTHFAMVLWRQ